MLHQYADTRATRAAVGGVEGVGEVMGYRGIMTLASWGPVRVSGVKWGLVSKVDAAEAFAPVYRLERDLMIVGAVALLVVSRPSTMRTVRSA